MNLQAAMVYEILAVVDVVVADLPTHTSSPQINKSIQSHCRFDTLLYYDWQQCHLQITDVNHTFSSPYHFKKRVISLFTLIGCIIMQN